jgi:hypothetical protein
MHGAPSIRVRRCAFRRHLGAVGVPMNRLADARAEQRERIANETAERIKDDLELSRIKGATSANQSTQYIEWIETIIHQPRGGFAELEHILAELMHGNVRHAESMLHTSIEAFAAQHAADVVDAVIGDNEIEAALERKGL